MLLGGGCSGKEGQEKGGEIFFEDFRKIDARHRTVKVKFAKPKEKNELPQKRVKRQFVPSVFLKEADSDRLEIVGSAANQNELPGFI